MRIVKRWQAAVLAGAVALALVLGVALKRRHRSVAGVTDGGPSLSDAGLERLAGRIVDRLGRPLGGAQVTARPEVGGAILSASTGEDGRFVLAAQPGEWRVRVEAAGFQTEELRHVTVPEDGLELALARQLALEGLVRAHGRPVAGADVQIAGPSPTRATRSGPDGAFSFRDLPEGNYALRATHEHEAAFLDAVAVGLGPRPQDGVGRDDPDAGAGVLTVELQAATQVQGRLLERSGRAIAGGEVTLSEATAALLERKVPTASDGSFRFEAVLPGSYAIAGRAAGYFGSESHDLEVPSLKWVTVDLRLERGAVVEGVVVDEQGKPVTGAQIEIAGEGLDGAPVAVSAAGQAGESSARLEPAGELGILRGPIPFPPQVAAAPSRDARAAGEAQGFVTDGKGAFRLIGLPAGKLVVAVSHPDYARGASVPAVVGQGATTSVRVVLAHGETVRGRVLSDRGDPLAGAELFADGRTLAVSDARGEFEVAHVAHGLTLTARLPGYLPSTRPVQPGAREAVELTLQRAEGRLGGVVVDDRGTAVAGAKIELHAAVVPPRQAATDRAGHFQLDALGPGPYRVKVTSPDFAPLLVEDVAPGDDARFALLTGGGLAGEVRDARTGALPDGARVELIDGSATRPLPLKRGHFEATGLPAGKQTLSASAPGYVTVTREVEVPAGDHPREVTVRDLTIDLDRGGAILGHARGADGDPLAGAPITCGALHTRTDARGDFRLDGVPPGSATVRLDSGTHHVSETVELRAGDDSRVELRLR